MDWGVLAFFLVAHLVTVIAVVLSLPSLRAACPEALKRFRGLL
jgi:hypothetical protein